LIMTDMHAPALPGVVWPTSFRQRLLGYALHTTAIGAAAVYCAFGAIAAQAAEIGTTFEKPCPFGVCAAGIAFTYLGEAVIQTGYSQADIEFGGISGLDYDPATGRYIALSDDRAERGPVRVYDLDVDVSAAGLQRVSVVGHTPLRDEDGRPFKPQSVDPEALRLAPEGIYWTSEGGGKAQLPPSVRLSSPDGAPVRVFDVPTGFAPDAESASGTRENLSFEALAVLPSGDVLAALETSLRQDGEKPSLSGISLARMVQYDGISGKAKAQYVYPVSPIPEASVDGDKAMTGLSEMIALDDGWVLTIERSFAEGVGNTIKLFMIDLAGATDVSAIPSLTGSSERIVPVRKTEVLDLNGMGIEPDNIEAMAIGKARDGTEILLLAADNNFSGRQKTQFLAFKMTRKAR
jgi:hypothetical protein